MVSQPAILLSDCRGLNLIEIAYNDTQLPGSPFRFVSYTGRVLFSVLLGNVSVHTAGHGCCFADGPS